MADDGAHRAFAITEDGLLVGLVGVSIDLQNRLGWFWYWMNTRHPGRGARDPVPVAPDEVHRSPARRTG